MEQETYIVKILLILFCLLMVVAAIASAQPSVDAVCPPFFLRDEAGEIINPIEDLNADKPYSPKQTCVTEGCHNYDLITQGYHFTQGAGEEPTAAQSERCQWVSMPGNYGGSWCSPAPPTTTCGSGLL